MNKTTFLYILCLSFLGCGKSLDGQIATCSQNASDSLASFLPSNEFQKKELEDREQEVFYQCMIKAGFKEKAGFAEQNMKMLKENYPRATASELLEKLNTIRSQSMRRSDALYTLWKK